MIYQELSLAPHLSVAENILLGMEPRIGPFMNWRKVRQTAAAAMPSSAGPTSLSTFPWAGSRSRPSSFRDRPGGRRRLPRAGARRAHQQPLAPRRRASFRAGPAAQVAGDRHRLHLPLPGRSEGRLGRVLRAARREKRRLGPNLRGLQRHDRVDDGRTRRARSVSPLRCAPGAEVLTMDHLAGDGKPVEATLSLRRGEVVGIAGVVGAGRTELLRVLFGLDPVRSGQVGMAPTSAPPRPAGAGPGRRDGQRRPQDRGAGAVALDRRQRHPLASQGAGPGGAGDAPGAGPGDGAVDRSPVDQVPRPAPAGQRSIGRQPAEGGDRPPASSRRQRAPARRADARDRHRVQGAGLRTDRPARHRQRVQRASRVRS